MIVNDSNLSQKVANFYSCIFCDYNTCKKYDYVKHLQTLKHRNNENDSKLSKNDSDLSQKVAKSYKCICGKTYKYDSGYYRHKKICKQNNDLNELTNVLTDKNLIIMLIQQNKELLDIVKNGTNNTLNSNNNSNNKTFNMHFFLNETCKDAINIDDFVKNIKIQLSDLEETGRVGYVQGVSNIIKKNLNDMETHNRPMHCSDIKREILYIKDDNEWIKETDDKPILTKAIKKIANENIKKIFEFKKLYPDCTNSESNKNNLYLNMISNSISGSTKEETDKNINKVIKNLMKEIVIEK